MSSGTCDSVNDLPWPIPIVLDVDKDQAGTLKVGKDVLLAERGRRRRGRPPSRGKIRIRQGSAWPARSSRPTDAAHPGVAKVLAMKDVLLGGKIDLVKRIADSVRPLQAQPARNPGPVQGKGLADGRRLPDAEHSPHRPRIRPEGRPDLRRRHLHQPRHRQEEEGRLQGRGHPRLLRGAHQELLPEGAGGHGHPA